jgi:hypothetical protein
MGLLTSGSDGEGVVVVPHGRAGVGAPHRGVEGARRAVLQNTTKKTPVAAECSQAA